MRVSSSWGTNWLTTTAGDQLSTKSALESIWAQGCFSAVISLAWACPELLRSRSMHTGRCKTEQKETTRAAPSLRQAGLQKMGPGLKQSTYWINRVQNSWRKENGILKQRKKKTWEFLMLVDGERITECSGLEGALKTTSFQNLMGIPHVGG